MFITKLLRLKLILLVLIMLPACGDHKKYVLKIDSMHTVNKDTKEEVRTIEAKDDSSAYKDACQEYWIVKSSKMKVYKEFEVPDYIPFYFSVERENGFVVGYPKEEAERLTREIVDYFKNKVMPGIDTITPYSKRKKEQPANIY